MLMRFHPRTAVGHSSARYYNTVTEQPRPDTPMEVDTPSAEGEAMAMTLGQDEGSTDSEDSRYERRDDEEQQSPLASELEAESETESLEQEPDSEEDSLIYS